MKLIEEIRAVHDDKEMWAYYKSISDIDLEDIIKDPQHFIIQYLHLGEKVPSELMTDFYFVLDKYRMYHTISLFYFGIIIYKNCGDLRRSIDAYLSNVNKKILKKSKINDILWNPSGFSYYWFLICFFHDFSYQIVRNFNIIGENNLLLFNTDDKNEIKEKISRLLGTTPFNRGAVPPILRKLCPIYHRYRLGGKEEEIDHGVFAGTYFYYDREKQLKTVLSKDKDIKKYSEVEIIELDKNLIWSTYILENIHADVSWIVACHNIWFQKKSKNDKQDNNAS